MGWRTITIDDIPYVWQVRTEDDYYNDARNIRIVVRRTDQRGLRTMATFFDSGNLISPWLVRQAIEHALANGWRAAEAGPLQTFTIAGVVADRRVAQPARPPAPRDEGDLLDAIWTADDPRAARLVYADWLLEKGDPRGELIALANTPELDADGRARLAELVTASATWLAPIIDVIRYHRWEHGMLAYAQLGKRAPGAIDRARGHAAWITLQGLDAIGERMTAEEAVAIATHPILRNLRALLLGISHVRAVATTLPRLEELHVAAGNAADLAAEIAEKVPALRRFSSPIATVRDLARLVEHEVADTILAVDPGFAVFSQLPKLADALAPRVRELGFVNHVYGASWSGPRVDVTVGSDGRWSALAVTWDGSDWEAGRAFVERAITALPQRAVTSIAIDRARVPAVLARYLAQAAARRDVPVTG